MYLIQGQVTYIHSTTRPKNKKEDRVDRRKVQNPDKRCILVIRNKTNTRTFVINTEEENSVLKLVKENVDTEHSTIHADENPAYNILHGYFNVKRVNHSKEYRSDDGTTNNYAERYFSRFRRLQIGQVHKISNKYLSGYAKQVAYREDTRSISNGIIIKDILSKCLSTKINKQWCGY